MRPQQDRPSGTRVAVTQKYHANTDNARASQIEEGGRYHALGHLNCRNLCGRNLCHSLGVVAGVMNSQVQHLSHLPDEMALGGREGFADYLPYTPLELLTGPYRDRLSCMA